MLVSKKNYFEQKRKLEGVLDDAMVKCETILDKRQAETLKAIRESALRSQKFPIVFAGRFSVGKSHLINSLFLEEDFLPTSIKPTTARKVEIRYGEDKKFIVYKSDPSGKKHVSEELPANQEAIRRYCTHFGDKKDAYEYFELVLPLDFLKSGVAIVDTVGTEDIDDKYVSHTINAINEAAAVVFVTDGLQPLAKSEQDFIALRLRDTSKKLFLVANKIDGRSPDERILIKEDLEKRFSDFYRDAGIRAGDRIFMVSGKTGDGLDGLRLYLLKFIQEEQVKEIVTQAASGVQHIFQAALADAENEMQACILRMNGEEDKVLQIQEEMSQIDLALNQIKDDKMFQWEGLVEYSTNVIENAVMEAKNQVLNKAPEYSRSIEELFRLIAIEVQKTSAIARRKISAKILEILSKRIEFLILSSNDDLNLLKEKLLQIQSNEGRSIRRGTMVFGSGIIADISSMVGGYWYYITKAAAILTTKTGALTLTLPYVIPVVAISSIAIFLGHFLKNEAEKTKNFRTMVVIEDGFNEILTNSLEDLQKNLELFFDRLIDTAISEHKEKKRKLEEILSSSDMGSLKEHIKRLEVDAVILRNYIADLNIFVEA